MRKNATAKGTKGEDTSCPLVNTGLFGALQAAGVGGLFSGHDHQNDNEGKVGGVILGYGRKTGYGSYGPDPLKHGARVLVLREGRPVSELQTWVAEEDGGRDWQRGAGRGPVRVQKACGGAR